MLQEGLTIVTELLMLFLTICLAGAVLILAISIRKRVLTGKQIPKLFDDIPIHQAQLVSIIVPFRNEEANLPTLLEMLKQQDYPNIEIILANDQSTDNSLKIAENFAKEFPNTKVVSVKDRPAGWVGKTWACEQGFKAASGEWLLFTDADVKFEESAVRRALGFAISKNLDVLTLMPKIVCRSIWAKLIQPFFYHFLLVLYSPLKVNDVNNPFAYVFGAFFLIRKSTYIGVGTHEAVKNSIIEDRAFGALAKQKGAKLLMIDGSESYSSVWASTLSDVIHGMERIASFSISVNPFRGVFFAAGVFVITTLPFLVVPAALFWYSQSVTYAGIILILSSLAATLVVIASSIEVLGPLKLSIAYIIAAPIGGLLFAAAMLTAAYKNAFRKRIVWKGRAYSTSEIEF